MNAITAKSIKASLPAIIVGYVIAATAIVLGALCLADVITSAAQLIIFGILVCIYAVFMVLNTFTTINTTVVIVSKENKTEAPAEEAKAN